MDEAVNRYARELIDAINAAVANDPVVQACRERARAAGIDLKISLEAVAGFADRSAAAGSGGTLEGTTSVVPPSRRLMPARRQYEVTAADRRFLRSLRIAAEETSEPTA
jgi:hypothetical protein